MLGTLPRLHGTVVDSGDSERGLGAGHARKTRGGFQHGSLLK